MGIPEELGKYRPLSYFQMMEVSLRELLVEKGVVSEAEMAQAMQEIRARGPERGAKMVARAWLDPAYKERMLANGSQAAEELGFEVPGLKLIVVANTPAVHNVIVCTLCSCYPRMLLGLPPDWYKSHAYRRRVVREPRAVLAEFGTEISEAVTIRVHDSTADMRYMVLPLRPAGTEGWSEEQLAGLVTRDSLIGVKTANNP
ncbi:MAG: nitrile hydratase subunit alpha [Betaproteobacteria bacterium]|nr:nitrile hydratase subunit alpha [Betaproteobacteria bacterium]